MSRAWIFTVPGLPTLQKKQHHQATARERRRFRDATLWALKQEGVRRPLHPLLERARLIFTRHSFGSSVADDDNLAISFKAHRDALVKWLIRDDSPDVVQTQYGYGDAPPKQGYVKIVVMEGWGDTCPACGQTLPPIRCTADAIDLVREHKRVYHA